MASTNFTAHADDTSDPAYLPSHFSGVYRLGETVSWRVTPPSDSPPITYVIRKNNLEEIARGTLQPGNVGLIEARLDEPAMLYVEILPNTANAQPKALGAAVEPDRIGASLPPPEDFDAFWRDKIRSLRRIPARAQLIPKASDRDGIEFGILRLDQLAGKHVWAQMAKPQDVSGKKKYPALVILEWGPPHPLAKATVADRAAEGWLAVNIEPHDVLPDQPQSYYDALPSSLQQFETSGPRDRDHYFLLYMYLGNIRVIDYVADRSDWDRKTLVVIGTSMGGLQTLCAAALHPKVTALSVNSPAGADANGLAHGRQVGWPWLGKSDPMELQTARYFDAVNCARRIKVPSFVAFGFIDILTPPVGNWAIYNAIRGPKEVMALPNAGHVYLWSREESMQWTLRAVAWLDALRAGRSPIESANQRTSGAGPN